MFKKNLDLPPSKQFILVLSSDLNLLFILYFYFEFLSSASEKAKLVTEIFSEISSLDETGTFLSDFPLITNLILDSISVIPRKVKKS